MLNFNTVGRLVKEPESKVFGDRKVLNFSIATNHFTNKGDTREQAVTFMECTYWVKSNSTLPAFLKKGVQVYLIGHIVQERWEQDNVKRSKHVAMVSNLELVGSREDSEQGQPQAQSQGQPQAQSQGQPQGQPQGQSQGQPPAQEKIPEIDIDDDEIPF